MKRLLRTSLKHMLMLLVMDLLIYRKVLLNFSFYMTQLTNILYFRVINREKQHMVFMCFENYEDFLFSKILEEENPGPLEAFEKLTDYVYFHVFERKPL